MTSERIEDAVRTAGKHHRSIWLAFATFLIATATLVGVGLNLFLTVQQPHRLGAVSDPSTISNRVDGIEGPAAHMGDILQVSRSRCFRENVVAVTSMAIVSMTTDKRINLPPGVVTGLKGCEDVTSGVQLPDQVLPGRWRLLTNVQTITEPSEVWSLSSEPFTVVP